MNTENVEYRGHQLDQVGVEQMLGRHGIFPNRLEHSEHHTEEPFTDNDLEVGEVAYFWKDDGKKLKRSLTRSTLSTSIRYGLRR